MSNTDNRYRHPRKDTCSPKVYDLKKPFWTEFGKQCQKNQEQPESLGWTCRSSILVPSNKPLNFVAGVRPPLPFYFKFCLCTSCCLILTASLALSELFLFVPLTTSWSEESTRNHLTDVPSPNDIIAFCLAVCSLVLPLSPFLWGLSHHNRFRVYLASGGRMRPSREHHPGINSPGSPF